jgi:hypothetical protein
MTPKEEAQKIFQLCGKDLLKSLVILENHLNTLHTRAQVLISLAGIVITVTGFSGRIIAGTNLPAQILIISGLAIVLISAVFVTRKVMRVKWVTTDIQDDSIETLVTVINRRNRKTRAFYTGGIILSIGLLLYCAAISIMLLNP